MKNTLGRLFAALLLTAGLALPIAVASPASANTCSGPVVQKVADGHGRTFDHSRGIDLYSHINYLYCPNGTGTNLVKATSIRWCWDWDGNPSQVAPPPGFHGVNFNSFIQDNNEVVNPDTYEVWYANPPDNFCQTQNIPASKELWLEMPQSPRFWAKGSVILELASNPSDTWTGDFTPCRDPGGPVAC